MARNPLANMLALLSGTSLFTLRSEKRMPLNASYRPAPQDSKRRERSEFQKVVHRMTKYERTQWARAGYPGLMGEDIRRLKAFMVTPDA